jgi:hypothetical protein
MPGYQTQQSSSGPTNGPVCEAGPARGGGGISQLRGNAFLQEVIARAIGNSRSPEEARAAALTELGVYDEANGVCRDVPAGPTPEGPASPAAPDPLQGHLDQAVAGATADWQQGGVSTGGRNRRRVDEIVHQSGFQYTWVAGLDWCGIFVAAHYASAGMDSDLRAGFYHTDNVINFFNYNPDGRRVHASIKVGDIWRGVRDYHAERGSLRRWTDAATIRSALAGGNYGALDIRPGDVVLIDHENNGSADHITMVQSYDASTGMLTTIEGNAAGTVVAGKDGAGNVTSTRGLNTRTEGTGVTTNQRDLSDSTARLKLYGIGRPSAVDFEAHEYSHQRPTVVP